jgi:hypothetical protein
MSGKRQSKKQKTAIYLSNIFSPSGISRRANAQKRKPDAERKTELLIFPKIDKIISEDGIMTIISKPLTLHVVNSDGNERQMNVVQKMKFTFVVKPETKNKLGNKIIGNIKMTLTEQNHKELLESRSEAYNFTSNYDIIQDKCKNILIMLSPYVDVSDPKNKYKKINSIRRTHNVLQHLGNPEVGVNIYYFLNNTMKTIPKVDINTDYKIIKKKIEDYFNEKFAKRFVSPDKIIGEENKLLYKQFIYINQQLKDEETYKKYKTKLKIWTREYNKFTYKSPVTYENLKIKVKKYFARGSVNKLSFGMAKMIKRLQPYDDRIKLIEDEEIVTNYNPNRNPRFTTSTNRIYRAVDFGIYQPYTVSDILMAPYQSIINHNIIIKSAPEWLPLSKLNISQFTKDILEFKTTCQKIISLFYQIALTTTDDKINISFPYQYDPSLGTLGRENIWVVANLKKFNGEITARPDHENSIYIRQPREPDSHISLNLLDIVEPSDIDIDADVINFDKITIQNDLKMNYEKYLKFLQDKYNYEIQDIVEEWTNQQFEEGEFLPTSQPKPTGLWAKLTDIISTITTNTPKNQIKILISQMKITQKQINYVLFKINKINEDYELSKLNNDDVIRLLKIEQASLHMLFISMNENIQKINDVIAEAPPAAGAGEPLLDEETNNYFNYIKKMVEKLNWNLQDVGEQIHIFELLKETDNDGKNDEDAIDDDLDDIDPYGSSVHFARADADTLDDENIGKKQSSERVGDRGKDESKRHRIYKERYSTRTERDFMLYKSDEKKMEYAMINKYDEIINILNTNIELMTKYGTTLDNEVEKILKKLSLGEYGGYYGMTNDEIAKKIKKILLKDDGDDEKKKKVKKGKKERRGRGFREKYIKYKNKYLELKKLLENEE